MRRLSVISLLPCLLLGAVSSMAGESSWRAKAQARAEEGFSSWKNRPSEPFKDSAETFQLVKKELLKSYHDKGITEDDLYRAAVQGMLQNIEPTMKDWNVLMSPTEVKELHADIEGKIVGIGTEVSFNETSGYAEVRGVIPGTPAAKAGLTPGDRILRIDGKSYKGEQLRDIVYAIRGKAGTTVKLTVLHGEEIKNFSFKRESLVWDSVKSRMLPGKVGLLAIRNFTSATPQSLKDALGKLKGQGMSSLIVDLRGNQGGTLEAARDSIRLFIPKDKVIVRYLKRDQPEELIRSEAEPLYKGPMVVLINEMTMSSGEIMAAALKMSAQATTVGARTYGKWSVQSVDELPNGYGIKFTIGTMRPPEGEDLAGKGLKPDIQVGFDAAEAQKLQSLSDTDALLNGDVQLDAALQVLKLKK